MRFLMSQKSRFIFLIAFLFGLSLCTLGFSQEETAANKAAKASLIKFSLDTELAGQKAPQGKIYVLLQTEWENIHPKQKVKKSNLEGKQDRTMGVGTLREGKKEEKKGDYVDMDVPYLIPNFFR